MQTCLCLNYTFHNVLTVCFGWLPLHMHTNNLFSPLTRGQAWKGIKSIRIYNLLIPESLLCA